MSSDKLSDKNNRRLLHDCPTIVRCDSIRWDYRPNPIDYSLLIQDGDRTRGCPRAIFLLARLLPKLIYLFEDCYCTYCTLVDNLRFIDVCRMIVVLYVTRMREPHHFTVRQMCHGGPELYVYWNDRKSGTSSLQILLLARGR